MKYMHWGNREDCPFVSRLGFGTTKFIQDDLQDQKGLKRCIELVEYAIQKGINYFDVAPPYANGNAEKILGKAFQNADKPIYVAAKSGLMIDKTADDILRRIDTSMGLLKRDKIDFYHIWSVMNWQQYLEARKDGGVLQGVIKARDLGLIDHICISLHCDPETTLRIMDEGIFEGITISMNALNFMQWETVLRTAKERSIAVATMNSLAGGTIPKYENLFRALDKSRDSVPIKALRFVLQQPGVNVALSGMPTKEIIDENCSAVDRLECEISDTSYAIPVKEALCTGCNYCAPCTVGIPISSCMQAYNHRILVQACGEKRGEQQIVNDVFIRVRANGAVFPDLKSCIGCHRCELRCTQKINICERIHWLEAKSKEHGYDHETMKRRLSDLERKCAYSRKIAVWPAADYANKVLDYWNNPSFEKRCVFVNASPAMWDMTFRGSKIVSPDDIEKENVDTIVIMHYRLQKTIYDEARKEYPNLNIVCLHEDTDIDWFQWFTRLD